MIEKIISIKNYGPFTNYTSGGSEWDGSLKKNNIIYAPNGSGKTTLSILFDSLNGNNKLITKKKIIVCRRESVYSFENRGRKL